MDRKSKDDRVGDVPPTPQKKPVHVNIRPDDMNYLLVQVR